MKKVVWQLLLILGIIFITMQFFQPPKNSNPENGNHLFQQSEIPVEVQAILQNACFDCHSNQTRYPWYDRVSPVSWYINNHIKDGKNELNFSEWGKLQPMDKISLLNKIIDETKEKKMPLKSYTLIHRSAKLTDDQIKQLADWAENIGMEIYKAK